MLFAETDAYLAGRIFARVIFIFCSIAGILKCLSISRRPATSYKCVLALTSFLAMLLVSSLRLFLKGDDGNPAKIIFYAIAGLAIFGFMVASIVLGIWGLAEYDPKRFVQGRAQAIWALALNGLILFVAVCTVASRISKSDFNPVTTKTQLGSGEVLTFKDLNFQFLMPGRPWVKWDASRLKGDFKVTLVRSNPEMYMMISAEPAGSLDYTSDSLADLANARMRSSADSLKVIQKTPARVNDLDGVEVLTDARVRNVSIAYVQWFCATNGWLYQITTWGAAGERQVVQNEARLLRENFRPLDYSLRPAIKNSQLAGDFVSTNFGYRVHCANSDWTKWSSLDTDCQFASYGALHRNAVLAVGAVSLADLPQEPDAIYRGMFGMVMTTDVLKTAQPIQQGKFEGVEVSITRANEAGKEFAYRMKVLRGEDYAYLIAAWVSQEDPDREKVLADAMSRVELETPKTAPDAEVLSAREKRGERLAFNGIGMVYFNEQRFEQSAPFFKKAVDLDGLQTNTPYLQNFAEACMRTGAYRTALDELERHPEYVESHNELTATHAFLEGQLGQMDEAISNYSKIFAGGYRSEVYFRDYITLLAKAQQQEKAVTEVDTYLKREDSVEIRLLQAELLVGQKQWDRALPLLQSLHKKNPFHAGVTYALGGAMIQNGKPSEALALSAEMMKQTGPSVTTWTLKGRAQYALKWYREAKESFNNVLKNAPENRDARQFLDAISSMLGEGSNISVRDPIASVPLPAEFSGSLPEAPLNFGKDEGAFYSRKITAVSFKKGKELKTTEVFNAHVLSAAGVSAFSSFQISFNPLSQEIFVNQLAVKNGAGDLVSTGHVADYYVLDDRTGDSANDRKILNIPVAGLEPGDTVEFTYTLRELGNVDEFTFLPCIFSTSFPIQERILYFAGDTNSIRFVSSPQLDPQPVSGGLSWREAAPPLVRWEPLLPTITDYLQMVWLSDAGAQWPSLVTNYLESIHDRLELPAEQVELAKRLTAHATNVTQKIDAVASYVQTNYTYRAIEFGRRARIPQAIPDLVRNKYGDCKDHSLLAQQLLKAAGVPANLALLNLHSPIRQDLPSLDQFDHMVVYIPSAENHFLDCTAKGFDLSASAFGLEKREALILDEHRPRFEKIPDYPTNASMIEIVRSVGLTNQTDVRVREKLTVHGLHAGWYRQFIRSLPVANRRSYLANQFFGLSAEVEDFKIQNLEDFGAPLVLEFVYLTQKQFHAVDNEMVGNAPVTFERGLFLDQAVEARTSPFEIPIPLTVQCSVDVDAPAGFKPRPIAEMTPDIKNQFVSGHFSSTTTGTGWRMNYRVAEISGRFTPGEYAAHNLAMRQTVDMLAPRLVCVRQGK